MSPFLRLPTIMVVVCALVAGLTGDRVFASTRIAADAGTDRDALSALYQATNGDSWISNDNWLSEKPISDWYGVALDVDGRVSELVLNENQLRGHIPPELGNLSNLTVLSLYSNQLSGTIPSELGNLSSLEVLALSANQLNGSIPPELSKLSDLQVLALWDNKLRGPIPPELGKLSSLEWLDLSVNRMTGTIPSELSNLISLETLSLFSNQLRGSIPADLGKLTALEELYLSENRLSGTIPPELGNLIRLETLFLFSNQLSGSIPAELGNLSDLKLLYLSDNRLSGTIPPELGNLARLETLFLFSNQLSGSIPASLGRLTSLTKLGLADNHLSGSIPADLGRLTSLTELGLWGNRLSGLIPPELGRLISLEWLHISDNLLSGCVPEVWRDIEDSDLYDLGLPFCTTPPRTVTETPETLTRTQVFAKVSPAIAFIQTEIGSGSGVLIEGGYVVTNAHVVWPFDAARVVFPDGTEFGRVPVKGWDLLTDLAVLGPIEVPTEPVTLRGGEDIPTASDMYLIGYPGEVEANPQPTFVAGSLSRLRQWEPVGVTYFQVDALIIGGQSGGALVSAAGEVIGISGFKFEEEFALAASSADILPRIRRLIEGDDPAGLGERQLSLEGGVRRHELTLQSYGDAYILNEPVGTAIEVDLSGADEGGFRIFDAIGLELTNDKADSFSFVTNRSGPHFLVVSDSGSGRFSLIANRPLTRFDDPERDKQIRLGHSLHGNIDFPADIDFFTLRLEKDETVEIVARSALANTYLAIWDPIAEEWARDDDSGGGLFGEDARVIFQAPQTGDYDLFVADAAWSAPGGYVISVKRAEETDTLTTLASSGTPTRPVPVVSIHNALVIPIGDAAAVPAGDIHEWFPAGYEPPTGPTVTVNGTMNVRGGPGTNYPVIGTATAGQQYAALSRNAAGDWWQIEYEGRLAWVYGGLVTPSAGAANAPQADRSGWLTYEDEARGLSLSYPPGWRYFNPAQPSQADLALLSAARKGGDEQLDFTLMGAIVSAMSPGSEDAVIGLGVQADNTNGASSNFMLAFSFAAAGLSLEHYAVVVADQLQDGYGIEAASVKLVPELRPLGEEAVSIRYREGETNSEVWQVWLLSPDEETLLAIAFSVHSDEFAEWEPLLREIVQKVQWANQPAPTFPVVTINGNMNVRGGPGTFYPVLGTASAGEQFAITGKNPSGAWWRISYYEQSGWVFGQLVTASGPLEDIPLVKAFDWDAFHDSGRRLWIFYPPGWFFFDPLQTSEADRKSLGDLIGQENAARFLRDFAADMDTGQKERYVGFGFKIASDSTAQIEVAAFAADGLTLGQIMSIVQEGLRESGLDVDSAEMVTNLRYDGAGTVSIRYRDNRTGLGSEKIYWQVWTVSPDKGTFLRISFILQSSESAQLVPLLSEMVRRIRWE